MSCNFESVEPEGSKCLGLCFTFYNFSVDNVIRLNSDAIEAAPPSLFAPQVGQAEMKRRVK